MNRDNKSNYFIGVGSTINTIRFIGPFNRLVLAKKFYKRNEGDPAFNPHKEIVQIYKVITPKIFLEESRKLFEKFFERRNVIDFLNYKKKRK
jgi:hypothetical protein